MPSSRDQWAPLRNIPFALNRNSWQANGLILWYPLVGPQVVGRVIDLASGQVGTVDGAPAWVGREQFGLVYNFDRVDDSLDTDLTRFGGVGLFCDSNERFTASAWFYRTATGVSHTIIGRAGGTAGSRTFNLLLSSGNALQTEIRGGAATTIRSNPPANTWHHVVVTWDGTTARGYYDGGVPVTLTVGTAAEETTQPIRVAGRGATGTNLFQGSIADVRIYNRALPEAQIRQLYAPQTRWDLFRPLRAITAAAAAGGGTAHQGAAALSGIGTLASVGQVALAGTSALAGAGSLASTASLAVGGASVLAGAGTVAASGRVAVGGVATLGGAATLAADASVALGGTTGAAVLAAGSSLAAAARLAVSGSAALLGGAIRGGYGVSEYGSGTYGPEPGLVAQGQVAVAGAAALVGTGTLAPTGRLTLGGSVALSGTGTLAAAPRAAYSGAATLAGIGSINASVGATAHAGSATLVGAAALVLDGRVVRGATAVLGGTGVLVALPRLTLGGAGVLVGTGALVSSGRLALAGGAALLGGAALMADASVAPLVTSYVSLTLAARRQPLTLPPHDQALSLRARTNRLTRKDGPY